jgi:hypothetical protein
VRAQDIPRTFPHHPWLETAEAQVSLRNVLLAFAAHNEKIGYCQSMNYVAGLLLLVMEKKVCVLGNCNWPSLPVVLSGATMLQHYCDTMRLQCLP